MDTENQKPVLLLVDDDPSIRDSLRFVLQNDYVVFSAESRLEAHSVLDALPSPPELALVDLGLPPHTHSPEEGFALIKELVTSYADIKILVLSGQDDKENVKRALSHGAADFIAKPCDIALLRTRLSHSLLIQQAEKTEHTLAVVSPTSEIVGKSVAINNMREQIKQFSDLNFPVLIEGESGTGKELVATALHKLSSRNSAPYLILNCAAISPQLMEAQLFGNAKGAFTGATGIKSGFFEDAENGTLFLDEIGEMPIELQSKLLRVLENGEFYRLGETKVRTSTARIVAATNRNLQQEVHKGTFRADLYHRLSVFTIHVPAVRERGEDKLQLLKHFCGVYSNQLKTPAFKFSPDAELTWLHYQFPGNVRELRNIVLRLWVRFPGQEISTLQLHEEFQTPVINPIVDVNDESELPNLESEPRIEFDPDTTNEMMAIAALKLQIESEFNLDDVLKKWEQSYIEAALQMVNGNLSKASKMLGINRTTLYSRIQKFDRTVS